MQRAAWLCPYNAPAGHGRAARTRFPPWVPDITPPFEAFGVAHAGALVLTALASIGLAALVRVRPRTAPLVRGGLFLALALLVCLVLWVSGARGVADVAGPAAASSL